MKLISAITLLLFTIPLFGQSSVAISTEKVKIDGKVYYLHNIKKGETLYSLGKAYNVTVDEIIKNNRNAGSGLKAGETLYIPVAGKAAPEDNAGKSTQAEQPRHMQAEQLRQEKAVPAASQKKMRPKRHSVKWYEELKDIAEKYNVSQEAIMEYNNLASPRLTRRQVLLIPTWLSGQGSAGNSNLPAEENGTALLFPADTATDPAQDAGPEAGDETIQPYKREYERPFGRRDVEIALILPLTSTSKEEGYNSQYMDFYTGALLAASDFKENGVTVTLNVYDQGNYNTLADIFNSEGFGRNQLVIGPVMAEDLGEAVPLAEALRIPIVSPMDQTAEKYIAGNSCFIQAPAGNDRQTENSVALLEKYCGDPRNHLMLIYQKGYEASNAVTEAKRFLEAENAEYSTLSYNILEGRTINTKMMQMMDTVRRHVVFVASNSEAFVNDVVRNLHLCRNMDRDITLIGLSKWKSFETIDVEDFHEMNLNLSLPFHIDYGSRQVKDFLFRYRALFNVEPTPYSFQGYDLTAYFAEKLARYGKRFIDRDSFPEKNLMQTALKFHRVPGGGLENTATKEIVYKNDYTVSQ